MTSNHTLIGPVPPGTKVGRWTVLCEASRRYGNLRHLRCRCECGTEREVFIGSLRTGASPSCGCQKMQKVRTHGMHKAPEHQLWRSMKDRCLNPKNKAFKNYGGRGITVCDEWRNSFESFFAHVGRRPSPELTLDRINNDGDYEPGNVRWATRKVQAANCRLTPERRRELGRRNATKRWSTRQSTSTSPTT